MTNGAESRAPVLLVLRALGLGDLLTAVPALRALGRAYPAHRLLLATSPWLAALVRYLPEVEELLPSQPLAPLPPWTPQPDVAVNLHGSGPESHRILATTEPRRMLAFRNEQVPFEHGPTWIDGEHEVRRWCRLVESFGVPADPTDLLLHSAIPRARTPGLTVVHLGAARAARRWPADRWAEVARAERAAGHRVVLTGTAEDVATARQVAQEAGLPARSVKTGRTDLRTLIRMVASAERLLSTDTGVAHLATAVATPSVVLFGPEPPSRWGPIADTERHLALWAGRTGDPQTERPDPGLLAIEPAQVVAAVRRLPPR